MTKKAVQQIIKTTSDFYEGNPPMDVLASELKVTPQEASEFWQEYKNAPPKPVRKARGKSRRRRTSEPKPVAEAGIEKIHELPISFLRGVCGLVSVVALIRSTGYVFDYFYRNDFVFWAILVSFVFVATIFITPQLIVTGIRQKKFGIALLGVVLLIPFSFATITITMDEIAFKRSLKQIEVVVGQESIIKAQKEVGQLDADIKAWELTQAQDMAERTVLLSQFAKMDEANGAYWQTKSSLSSLKKSIDTTKKDIDNAKKRREVLVNTEGYETTKTETLDGREIDTNRDMAFAIALDIVGPVFFAFALFLRKGTKRGQHERKELLVK